MVTVADNKPAEILSILKQHGLAGLQALLFIFAVTMDLLR
jgi:hypothetical protein